LRKKKWIRNYPIVNNIIEMARHKKLENIDFENDIIIDLSLDKLEIEKIFSSLSLHHYINFHKIKNIPLEFPFFGFKAMGLKTKPNFDNPDYDENKLKIQYTKIKILMNGNISLFKGNFRFLESSFNTFSTCWVSFAEGDKNSFSESEKDQGKANKLIPEKSEKKEEVRRSLAKTENDEKKTNLLQTSNAFLKKQTYMKKMTQRRNSQLDKGGVYKSNFNLISAKKISHSKKSSFEKGPIFDIQFPKTSNNMVLGQGERMEKKRESEEKNLLREIRGFFGIDSEVEKFCILNKDLVELWTIGADVTRGIEDFRKIKLWYQEMFESQTLSTAKNTMHGKLFSESIPPFQD
jgi:hypothetical protein